MVAFGGMREVKLWAQTTSPATVRFHYWPTQDPKSRVSSPRFRTTTERHNIAQIMLIGLPENTHFSYEIEIDGQVIKRPYPLRFQTQLRWQRRADPPDFKMATGSCVYINLGPDDHYGGGYEIFESIRAQRPDLMLWLGDNVYLGPQDWSSREGIFRRYATQRALPELQGLLGSVHHYAIWDDHDYGPNDANRSYPLKGAALDAFRSYWPNPNSGLPELAGIFGTFSWSDVDFFLLDDRTFRAPDNLPNYLDKPLLGDAQLTWLLDALSGSRSTFKVIAIGSQVLNPFSRFEGYAKHPRERDRLLKGIKERRIEGVIFLSGDRHFTELNRRDDDPQFYPLYDFTSSPLTSSNASSVGSEINNPLRVAGTLVKDQRNFGMLSFSGIGAERSLTLESRTSAGKLLWTHVIKASELKLP
jgi:alkaline phosphatase D